MIYRLYFNRCEDFPQIWSIDEGTIATEVNVVGFDLGGCAAKDGRVEDVATVNRDREPTAWVEVTAAQVVIEGGRAVFDARLC